ncbi:MAG: rhodanese-like domain-containing protein [Gemmatimonadaceae bacterium]
MSYKTGADLTEEARSRIKEVTPADVAAMRERGESAVYLDVREPNEWNLGRIPGAVFLPRGQLESKVEDVAQRDARVIIYCARGNRSAFAADTLQQMGYDNVASMSGGFQQWAMEGREVES